MTQADSVHSTPPTNTSPFRPIAHSVVGRLESSLCEIANMAGVNSSILEASLNAPAELRFRKGQVLIGETETEQLLFCAYHLEEMIKEFKAQYYAVLKANRNAEDAS